MPRLSRGGCDGGARGLLGLGVEWNEVMMCAMIVRPVAYSVFGDGAEEGLVRSDARASDDAGRRRRARYRQGAETRERERRRRQVSLKASSPPPCRTDLTAAAERPLIHRPLFPHFFGRLDISFHVPRNYFIFFSKPVRDRGERNRYFGNSIFRAPPASSLSPFSHSKSSTRTSDR